MPRSNRNSSTCTGAGARFPPTLWSMVLQAGQSNKAQSREALATLCQAYWYPLYAFLRQEGHTPHDSEDLTQAFFLHLLEHNRLDNVRQEKGKFRSFLLASLKHFRADEWRK